MSLKTKVIILFTSFLLSGQTFGQQVSFVSLYPSTAFMVGRLLPFQLSAGSLTKILQVRVAQGNGCQVIKDPFYELYFHLRCSQPTMAYVEVVFSQNNELRRAMTPLIRIEKQGREPNE